MTRWTVYACAVALSLAGASPAVAQVLAQIIMQEPAPPAVRPIMPPAARQPAPGVVPPHEVLTIVRSAGYNPLERPARRGVTYALRAVASDGWQVRLIVDARTGEILTVTQLSRRLGHGPGLAAAPPGAPPGAPPPGPSVGPGTTPAPGYIGPGQPGSSPQNPIYEDGRPSGLVPRPPAAVPSAPVVGLPQREPGSTPQIIAPEPGTGLLPPPPERFPNRAQPGPEPRHEPRPAPVKRTVSAAMPKSPPLPRPRPGVTPVAAPAAAPAPEPAAVPAPAGEPRMPSSEPKTPAAKSPADSLPH